MYSLESSHRSESNEYIQNVIFLDAGKDQNA